MEAVRSFIDNRPGCLGRFLIKFLSRDLAVLKVVVTELAAAVCMVFPERCFEQTEPCLIEKGGPPVYGIGIRSNRGFRYIIVCVVQVIDDVLYDHIPAVLRLVQFRTVRLQRDIHPRHFTVLDKLVVIEVGTEKPRYPCVVVPDRLGYSRVGIVLDEIVHITYCTPAP